MQASRRVPIARIPPINMRPDPILTPNDMWYRYAIYFRLSGDLERVEARLPGPLS